MKTIRLALTILLLLSTKERCSALNADTTLIEDLIVRRGVEDFMRLCPYTKLCTIYVNTTVKLNNYWNKYEAVCCGECSCDEDCGVDCCPDMAEEFLTLQYIQKRIEVDYDSCIYAHYKPKNTAYSFYPSAYNMIVRCPSSYERVDIAMKCEREYLLFDFNEDISYFGPVTSTKSKVTFQNSYCAQCHNVSRVDLEPWPATLKCMKGDLTITSIPNLPNIVIPREDCNILFKSVLENHQSCFPVIDKCNTTGKWAVFDPFLQTACHSYKSVYEGYRNVHCYMCNGHSLSTIQPICLRDNPQWKPMSFVALLDMSSTTEDTSTDAQSDKGNCTADSWYDPLKERCRSLHCPGGMHQTGTQCVPIYKAMETSQVFEFDITLTPNNITTVVDDSSLFQLNDAIAEYANTISANTSTTVLRLCSIHGFIRLDRSIHEAKTILLNQSLIGIRHVSYRIKVQSISIENMTATVEEIESYLRPEHFQQYSIHHRRVAEFLLQRVTVVVEGFVSFSPTGIGFGNTPIWLQFGFENGFDDRTDRVALLPIYPSNLESYTADRCENGLHVEIDATCAKIILSADEFRVVNNSYIYLTDIAEFVNTRNVIVAENGKDRAVCVDQYNSFVNETIRRVKKVSDDDEKILYTPLVLLTMICIVLSLLALLVTLVVYCLLPQLRTLPGKNIMALVVSLMVYQTLTLVNACVEVKLTWMCQAVGITLHFSLLSSFFWMFVCTAHTLRVITSLTDMAHRANQTKLFIKYVLFTESSASAIVLATICMSLVNGNSDVGYGDTLCYLSEDSMVLYTVRIPAGLVVVANLVMFLYLVIKLARMPDIRAHGSSERRNIIIFAKLSTITGLTWIFGYLYQFFNVDAFAYMFVVLNASQGVFILLSFVANKRVFSAVKITWSVATSSGQLKTSS